MRQVGIGRGAREVTAWKSEREAWSEIVDVLRGMGVEDLEIQAYRFLVQNGPATPSVVARETRQSRGRIYRVLRGLSEKSLAREDATRPIRYSPVPLADVLAVMVAQSNRRSALLKAALAYEEEQRQLRIDHPPAPTRSRPGDVSVIHGRGPLFTEARRYAVQAGEAFLIAGNGQLCHRLAKSFALLGELRAAIARGVDVQVRLQEVPGSERSCQFLAEELGADRVKPLARISTDPFMLVTTERGALFVLVQTDDLSIKAGADLGVRVSSPVAGALLRTLVTNMDHAPVPGATTSLQPGVAEGALMTARRHLRAMGTPASLLLAREAASGSARLADLQARGVDVRIVEVLPRADQSGTSGTGRGVPVPDILIVDDTIVFQWLPTTADPRPHAPARATTDQREVEFWTQFFDAAAATMGKPGATPTPSATGPPEAVVRRRADE